MQRGAREGHAGNVADEFVVLARADEVLAAAGEDRPRLVEVQQRAAERIDIAITGAQDTGLAFGYIPEIIEFTKRTNIL